MNKNIFIMDYEKAYKDALERMKSWARGEHPECFTEAQKAAEFIFPELAESEDERIRKALICGMNALKANRKETFAAIPIDDCIAWLEKQGKQKTTNKVEPKFKVGDWIISKYDEIYQVKEILTRSYNLLCGSGTEEINSISIVDNNSRLLTIFDIKNLIKQEEKQGWKRWNEEDIKFIDMLIKEKEDAIDLSCDVKESISLIYYCNALKLIKQRMKEQL